MIEVFKGDDWEINFGYKKNSIPTSITGTTEIKACIKGDTSDVEVTMTGGEINITNAEGGIGTISVGKVKTALVKKGKRSIVITKTDASGNEHTEKLEEALEVKERTCD